MFKPMSAYFVTVKRQGVSPLKLELLVRAETKDEAGELAAALAERQSGGMFNAARVRPARRTQGLVFDEAA
jgi:hypothetical protein